MMDKLKLWWADFSQGDEVYVKGIVTMKSPNDLIQVNFYGTLLWVKPKDVVQTKDVMLLRGPE
jgi:hypothetical protein